MGPAFEQLRPFLRSTHRLVVQQVSMLVDRHRSYGNMLKEACFANSERAFKEQHDLVIFTL